MDKINWYELPYHHENWEKNHESLMNPGAKVTWPQFVCEMVFTLRCQILNNYKDIKRGEGWSNQISSQVRAVIMQSHVLCNYFPKPSDDGLVSVAFKNYFRKFRPLKIGQFRKVRFTEKDGRRKLNITIDEQNVVKGIFAEYEKLTEQRDMMSKISATQPKPQEIIKTDTPKIDISIEKQPEKNRFSKILEMEKKLNG